MALDDDRDRVTATSVEAGAEIGGRDVTLGFSVMGLCVLAALIATLLS